MIGLGKRIPIDKSTSRGISNMSNCRATTAAAETTMEEAEEKETPEWGPEARLRKRRI